MKKVTIKTIAEVCNVSIGTVDRALNERGRISPETRKRIIETAESLGYQRNRFASALSKHRKYRIAVLTPRFPQDFFSFVEDGIDEAQKEMLDYGIDVEQIHTDFLNYEEQAKALNTIDKSQYDGLVLTASSDQLSEQLNAFVDAGIPVITFNSDAKSSKRLCFIGEDAYKSGKLCGSLMGRFLGGTGRVATLVSFMNPGSPIARLNGFMDALRNEYPGIEVLEPQEYKESETMAMEFVDNLIKQYGRLDGIFANSASGTVGMGRYFSKNNSEYKPVLIGYDVTPEVKYYLKQGICDVIVDQNPQKQSYYGVTLMCQHLVERWKPNANQLEIRIKLVLKDNADDYAPELNQDGHILL